MIHVLITVKESERFPGKNRLLAPYTIAWLLNEIAYLKESVKVYTVGQRSELPLRLPERWEHIKTPCENHLQDIVVAETHIAPSSDDVMVLAQLTQPVREQYLLARAVECIRDGNSCCVTVSEHPNYTWRNVSEEGSWKEKDETYQLKINGQLYAWRPGRAADVFASEIKHAVLPTRTCWGIVDIDTPNDIPPGLQTIAASYLYDNTLQCPLVVKNKKVLLIGSGKDIVGRGLGKRIDAGEWDVVVRCNHFYGDTVDVGTRTDLAVVREARFEKDFIDEAPTCPARVITTNDGVNFPKHLLYQAAQEVGHREASIGIIAARWLINCGARLSVIGIGHFPDGSWISQKTYPDGTVDTAGFCDWNKENAWWESRKDEITLL